VSRISNKEYKLRAYVKNNFVYEEYLCIINQEVCILRIIVKSWKLAVFFVYFPWFLVTIAGRFVCKVEVITHE
jgi:hypothetical protein